MAQKQAAEVVALFLPINGRSAKDLAHEANSLHLKVLDMGEDGSIRVRGTQKAMEVFVKAKTARLGIAIENIVATLNLNQIVDLSKLRALPGAQYNKSRFPGLILRPINTTEATFLIFKSGTVVCVGTGSEDALASAARALYGELRKAKALTSPETAKPSIVNIVAQVMLKGKIDVEQAASSLTSILFEPELFPGAIYRMTDPISAVFLLFESGRVICLKTHNEDELKMACAALDVVLRREALLWTEEYGLVT